MFFKIFLKKAVHSLRTIFYYGNRYRCIFCGGNFRKLFPCGINNKVAKDLIGGGYRYVVCPKCGSTDRERLIYFYLKQKTKILSEHSQEINLLHVAPERNLRKIFTSNECINYFPGDIDPNGNDYKIDITNISKFKDDFFDVIICNHVLEHVLNDKKAMQELLRVLSPTGLAILQVPISKTIKKTFEGSFVTKPQDREKLFGQKDHVRIYGKDYREKLKNVGFQLEAYDIKNDLANNKIERLGINKEEILYVCKKTVQKSPRRKQSEKI